MSVHLVTILFNYFSGTRLIKFAADPQVRAGIHETFAVSIQQCSNALCQRNPTADLRNSSLWHVSHILVTTFNNHCFTLFYADNSRIKMNFTCTGQEGLTGPPGDCVPDWILSRHRPSPESPLGGCGVVPKLYWIVRFFGPTSNNCPLNVIERNLWGQNNILDSVVRGSIYMTRRNKELEKWKLKSAACFSALPPSESQSQSFQTPVFGLWRLVVC